MESKDRHDRATQERDIMVYEKSFFKEPGNRPEKERKLRLSYMEKCSLLGIFPE